MLGLRSRQRGAALVEMAIALPLFLALVFGIIEFSVLLFNWSRVIDSTRVGARYAIVNSPECSGISTMVCDTNDPSATAPVSCSPAEDSPLLAVMRSRLATDMLTADQVDISYACSSAGFDERPMPVFKVTVKVTGMKYHFVTPLVFGVDMTMDLPDHATTRTSEDLYTAPTTP